MSEDKKWTTSRKDMDSFTTNEDGQTAHVVYLYPPDDEPRIPVFGSDPRARAESIADALNAALTLTWREDPPTEPGWYFWGDQIVKVCWAFGKDKPADDGPDALIVEFMGREDWNYLDHVHGRWAGPIAAPRDNQIPADPKSVNN